MKCQNYQVIFFHSGFVKLKATTRNGPSWCDFCDHSASVFQNLLFILLPLAKGGHNKIKQTTAEFLRRNATTLGNGHSKTRALFSRHTLVSDQLTTRTNINVSTSVLKSPKQNSYLLSMCITRIGLCKLWKKGNLHSRCEARKVDLNATAIINVHRKKHLNMEVHNHNWFLTSKSAKKIERTRFAFCNGSFSYLPSCSLRHLTFEKYSLAFGTYSFVFGAFEAFLHETKQHERYTKDPKMSCNRNSRTA